MYHVSQVSEYNVQDRPGQRIQCSGSARSASAMFRIGQVSEYNVPDRPGHRVQCIGSARPRNRTGQRVRRSESAGSASATDSRSASASSSALDTSYPSRLTVTAIGGTISFTQDAGRRSGKRSGSFPDIPSGSSPASTEQNTKRERMRFRSYRMGSSQFEIANYYPVRIAS